MRRCEGSEPPERLDALALRCDRPAAAALVRRDDDMDVSLEEVALPDRACAPCGLELLVRLEEVTAPRKLEAAFI